MSIKFKRSSILHVEDDPALARVAKLSLAHLGFDGELLQAAQVSEALEILATRAREKAPLDLILLDMQLPDGVGLDVLRHVKASPVWHRTPVIFLSSEADPKVVKEAYALGANCFLPKVSPGKGGLVAFKALYECWIEGALTPAVSFVEEGSGALLRSARNRNRTARFYLRLAYDLRNTPEQELFWLERALVEGNMANLLTFLQEQTNGQFATPEWEKRISGAQLHTEQALSAAEKFLMDCPAPTQEEIFRHILQMLEPCDEDVVLKSFDSLFPNAPVMTGALKKRVLEQIRSLVNLVLDHSSAPDLCRRAEALAGFADRLDKAQA